MIDSGALVQLIAAYLHQSWDDEFDTPCAGVDEFAVSETERAPRLRAEIQVALATYVEEADLEGYLDSIGLGFVPTEDGWPSHRAWLLAVADRVDELLAARGGCDGKPPIAPAAPKE